MVREVTLPAEFQPLQNRVQYVKEKIRGKEYSSTCPNPACGGSIHPKSGEWPDRFIMWPISDATGGPLGWCRKCGYSWTPQKEDDWEPPSPEEIARRIREQEKRIEKEIELRQVALKELRKQRKWVEYHANLTERAKEIWRGRGVDDWFQDYWKLGFAPEYKLWKKENGKWRNWWTSPTLAIPLFGIGWEANNIKHRLLKVPDQGRKYHQEYYKAPQAPFVCEPEMEEKGPLFLVEGEIKAMVTYITMDDPNIQMIGLPSMTPEDFVFEMLEEYEPIYFCPDPDAFTKSNGRGSPAGRVTARLGTERVRVIQLPDKIDDLINAGALDQMGLKQLLKMGRRYGI